MSQRILVTYASRAGSTAEVAQAIGETLRSKAPSVPTGQLPLIAFGYADAVPQIPNDTGFGGEILEVDVLPMQDVKDLSVYQAVVAGSAIRKSKWLPEAIQFMRANQGTLRHIPCATFTVCITIAMSDTEQYRSVVRGWVAPIRELVRPLSEGLFAGMLDFRKLPFNWDTLMLRLTVALGIFPCGDRRDWNAVRAWAEGLKPILHA